jgi:hypothetical protein
VLHALITFSVVQSAAFPSANALDETLAKLLKSPMKAIRLLKADDFEAGQYLATHLSGYATIRNFYEFRDAQDEDLSEAGTDAETARRKNASSALIAAINSAVDSIRGGIYNPSAETIVPIDNLLVLLGESLAFLNRKLHLCSFPD